MIENPFPISVAADGNHFRFFYKTVSKEDAVPDLVIAIQPLVVFGDSYLWSLIFIPFKKSRIS